MESDLLEAAVKGFISESVNQAKLILEGSGDEFKQFFNRGLKKYLEKQAKKYAYLKTLLKGNTPVYIYDIYYHLKLTKDRKLFETKSIKSVFANSNYVTIIGDAGSGKSTLIKHLFLNSIFEKVGIPILVELRYLNEYENGFEQYIYEKILENRLGQNQRILDRLLRAGKFIFFLDGFDELNSSRKSNFIMRLNSFINSYDSNKFILTTRPYSDVELLPLFHNYFIKGLERINGEIEEFIYKQLSNENELAAKIVGSIYKNTNQHIESFLKNPLLLSLYILTFQSDSSVPNQKYVFYRRVINALFTEHDSKTKLGFRREKATNLSQEQFEEILKSFCFISFFEGNFTWNIDYVTAKLRIIKSKNPDINFEINAFVQDIKLAIALWIDDNGMLSFAHRSLQEYFAALAIKNFNSSQNQRTYERIISRFSETKNSGEFENFLSLCEEMDALNFRKYYLLPILKELKDCLNVSNETSLGKSYLTFFTSRINLMDGLVIRGKSIEINEPVLKSIYVHFPHTQMLYNELDEAIIESKLSSCKFKIEKVQNPHAPDNFIEVKYISFQEEDVPDDFWNIIKERVVFLAEEFLNYIESSITEYETYIHNSEKLDEDLVNLI